MQYALVQKLGFSCAVREILVSRKFVDSKEQSVCFTACFWPVYDKLKMWCIIELTKRSSIDSCDTEIWVSIKKCRWRHESKTIECMLSEHGRYNILSKIKKKHTLSVFYWIVSKCEKIYIIWTRIWNRNQGFLPIISFLLKRAHETNKSDSYLKLHC